MPTAAELLFGPSTAPQAALEAWNPQDHPRGLDGRFGVLGIDRKKLPHAVSPSGRVQLNISRGKSTVAEFGPTDYKEGPWFYKTGVRPTRSRLKGHKKSTTRFNTIAGRRKPGGGYEAVKVPRRKEIWP